MKAILDKFDIDETLTKPIKKNKLYNLVILCSKCHDMIDRNDIGVHGWVKTNNGIKRPLVKKN